MREALCMVLCGVVTVIDALSLVALMAVVTLAAVLCFAGVVVACL